MNFLETFQNCRWVDLSVSLSPDHPGHWPGNNAMSVRRLGWYDNLNEPYFNRLLTMEEHTGTHFDAPPHFIPAPELAFKHAGGPGRQTVEQVPIEAMIKPACVIEAGDLIGRAENGQSPRVTLDRIKAWEKANGPLAAEDAVLLRTGWTDSFYRSGPEGKAHGDAPVLEKSVPAWPAPDKETLGYFIGKGIKLFGTDCPSAGLLDEIVECHYLALGAGLLFVENLTNLAALPPRGAVFFFLPLKLVGGSGSPGRAIAALPGSK